MDWHKLQHTLFNLDPTDPREDLAKLKQSVQGGSKPVEPTKDYVTESVNVPEGSLKLDKDYSVSDFAALAGVNLSESKKQKDGDYARRKTLPSAKAGRTKHPDEGKLVGDSIDNDIKEAPLDSVRAGIKSAQSGALAPDSAERFVKSKISGGGGSPAAPAKKPVAPAAKGQITDKIYSDFLKQYTTTLKTIAHDPAKKRQFDRFMRSMGEAIEEKKNPEPPKQRNPVAAYAQKSGAGVHKDQNKKNLPPRKEKHKSKSLQYESIKDRLWEALNRNK